MPSDDFVLAGQIEDVQDEVDETSNAAFIKTVLNNSGFIFVSGVYIPSTNIWTTHNSNSCVMFPVKAGATYKLEIGQSTAYALLRSRGYVTNSSPQFADGATSRSVTQQPTTYITIPSNSDAQYLYVASNTTKGRNIGTVTEMLPSSRSAEIFNDVNIVLSELDESTYESTGTYFINTSGKWASGQTNTGAFVPVTAGKKYRISNNTDGTKVFAWLQDKTVVVGNSPSWATGNNARTGIGSGLSVDEVAPSDATYLYVGSSGDLLTIKEINDITFISEQIEEIKSEINGDKQIVGGNLLKYYNITNLEKIDIGALTLRTCSLGNGTWYTSGAKGRHKAIEVSEGEQFVLIPSATSYIGWLNENYSPPYSNDDIIPFVTGRVRETVVSPTILKAPVGASYLVITIVDGSGNTINWDVYKCTALNIFAGVLKFKYASWNVGHFSSYDDEDGSDDPTIPADEVETMALRYKKVINDVSADALSIIEYDGWFDAAMTVETKDKIFPNYRVLEGSNAKSTTQYCCNSILLDSSKFLNNSAGETMQTPSTQSRYFKWDRCFVAGVEVCLVTVHFDFENDSYRQAQMDQVIERLSSYSHVIIAGDFNYNYLYAESETKKFTDAGYTVANYGYIGKIITKRNKSGSISALDNICVKGFKMDNIQVNEESWTLSDHKLISCDLTLL